MITKETLKSIISGQIPASLSEKLLAEECLRLQESDTESAPGQRQEGGFQPDLSTKKSGEYVITCEVCGIIKRISFEKKKSWICSSCFLAKPDKAESSTGMSAQEIKEVAEAILKEEEEREFTEIGPGIAINARTLKGRFANPKHNLRLIADLAALIKEKHET